MVATHYLYQQTQFGEDRCTQFRVNVVTHPYTHTHPASHKQTGPTTVHCAAASAQCKYAVLLCTATQMSVCYLSQLELKLKTDQTKVLCNYYYYC